MKRRVRLGVRTRLLLAVTGAVTIALAIGVAAMNVLLEQRLTESATGLARAQAETELSALRIVDGRLRAPEGPVEGKLGSRVWVFSGKRALEAPRVSPAVDRLARSLAGGPERAIDEDEGTRLYALPVVENGRRVGTVVAGVSLDPYEETAQTALIGSVALAALLLVAVLLVTRWILGRALLPVSRMTQDAAAWSDSDLERRFALGEPYDELTRLGATLDGLLERVAASLRHEQRFTAELSHELRTPLARIAAEAELALARNRPAEEYRAGFELVQRSADQMTRIVEALVAAARSEAGLTRTPNDAREAVVRAIEMIRTAEGEPVDRIRLALPPSAVQTAVEADLLERMLNPLLDNALRYGSGPIHVSVAASGTNLVVSVADRGPGVDPIEAGRIFEPGVRGSAADNGGKGREGAGLGLALALRLARSAGGSIQVEDRPDGATFLLVLPLA